LQRDLARVERYLRARGFLDAKARAGRIRRTSSNHVEVEVVVDEGPPTKNRLLTLRGVDALPPDEASAVSAAAAKALPSGKRFDEAAFNRASDVAKRALTSSGYAYAKVTSEAQIDMAAHTVDYTVTVDAGQRATFGPISIVGLDPDAAGPRPQEIPDSAVLRALQLREGDVFSTEKIDAGTQALLDLGVFSAVEIAPQLTNPQATSVPVIVRLAPTRLRVLRIGGGLEFDVFKSELHLLAGWENRNFLGGLRDLSLEWKPGVVLYPLRVDNLKAPTNPLPEQRFKLALTQPSFLEARTTGFIKPEFNVFPLLVAPDPPASDPVVGYVEAKTTIGVERSFWKRLHVALSYTVQVEDPFPYVGPLNSALDVIVLAYPQLVTNLDFRDSAVRPHSGVFLGNTLQVAGGIFGGDARDVRIQPEVRTYIPIGKHVTFGTRASLGFLFNFNYATDWASELATSATPKGELTQLEGDVQRMYFRGFFSGGPSLNRGFPLLGVSPYGVVPFLNPATANQQVVANCVPTSPGYNPQACFIPVGGSTLWELENEIRYQIIGPFSLANFCDMGDVSPNQADIRLTHLHLSCGGGARYDTPIGPIRFDVGYRIQRLQVLPFSSEVQAATPKVTVNGVAASPVNGQPPTIFGAPIAFSIGIGEAF